MSQKERIDIKVTQKMKKQIDEAVNNGHAVSMSEFIRSAITEKLQRL